MTTAWPDKWTELLATAKAAGNMANHSSISSSAIQGDCASASGPMTLSPFGPVLHFDQQHAQQQAQQQQRHHALLLADINSIGTKGLASPQQPLGSPTYDASSSSGSFAFVPSSCGLAHASGSGGMAALGGSPRGASAEDAQILVSNNGSGLSALEGLLAAQAPSVPMGMSCGGGMAVAGSSSAMAAAAAMYHQATAMEVAGVETLYPSASDRFALARMAAAAGKQHHASAPLPNSFLMQPFAPGASAAAAAAAAASEDSPLLSGYPLSAGGGGAAVAGGYFTDGGSGASGGGVGRTSGGLFNPAGIQIAKISVPGGGGGGLVIPRSSSLYVKNLPADADKCFLYEKFAPYGAIMSVKVLCDPETGACRGVGFVNFAEHDAAVRAMQGLHGAKVHDKLLHVSLQTPRIRAVS